MPKNKEQRTSTNADKHGHTAQPAPDTPLKKQQQ